jgi:membrane protein DedA with SNARE-associated domain
MSELSDFLLAAMVAFGAPLFGLFVMLGAAGAPFPTSLLVIAAGAFVQQEILNPVEVSLFGIAGAVLGDSISYGVGRLGSLWVGSRYANRPLWQRAAAGFERYGGLAIFFTRFLFTAIATPTNLAAGLGKYPYRRFLTLAIIGQAIWLGGYGSLGYAFGSQWEAVSEFVADFSGLALGITLLSAGIYLYLRRSRGRQKAQMTNLPSR